MSRIQRLYRVRATYPGVDGPFGDTRHYQTRQAAEHRASVWRQEYEDGRRDVDPELLVTITASNPITWPGESS